MGAGNPLLRSFDVELYQAQTYFIDFTNVSDDEVKDHCEANDEIYENITDERKCEIINSEAERSAEDFLEEWDWLEELSVFVCDRKSIGELSAEYRGSAIIMAETNTGYIVTTTDSESHHFAFGIVPKFKYDDLEQEVDYEQESKFDWYEARDNQNGYYDMVKKKAALLYNKQLKLFYKENEPVMRRIHECFAKNMSSRNGAWCSASLEIIGKDFKFL